MKLHHRWILVALLLAALSCNLPGQPAPTVLSPSASPAPPTLTALPTALSTPSGPSPTGTPIDTPPVRPALGVFQISVIVDLSSEPVPRDALPTALEEATAILLERTGFALSLIDVVEQVPSDTRFLLADRYLNTTTSPLPNGIVIFSFGDDDRARTYGGYSAWISGPEGFYNAFVSPLAGDRHVYVAFMHWSHRYARCGYGDSQTPISATSIDGECRNQPGTACTMHNGYSMCANAVDDLYASTPTYFVAANIVHEFMHPFGLNGVYDHYGTEACQSAMGWTPANWSFSLAEVQIYAGMCPNVYDNFVAGYQP